MAGKAVIGVDFGAFSTPLGVVDQKGVILISGHFPTKPEEGSDSYMKRLKDAIRNLSAKYDGKIDGIGLGIPSWDGDRGVISNPPNLPGFDGLAVVDELKKEFSAWEGNIRADNDANVALDAERYFGGWAEAGGGIIVFTLGGGVGFGAYLFDPKAVSLIKVLGRKNRAPEGGHIPIPIPPEAPKRKCGCGYQDCLEAYASATAVTDFAQKAVMNNVTRMEKTQIVDFIQQDESYDPRRSLTEQVTPLHVEQADNQNDPVALRIRFWVACALAHGIRAMVQIFDPAVVVICGGMSRWKKLIEHTRLIFHELPGVIPPEATIEASHLDSAGILGAAALILKR